MNLNVKLTPIVLYMCEIQFLTFREHKVQMFENKVLTKIFGHKRNEITS